MRERYHDLRKALTTAVAVAGAALLLTVPGAGFAKSDPTIPNPASPAPQGGGAARPSRPFEHLRHESVSCLQCHGTGERHATYLVRSARDCAGCHHDANRGRACGACHADSTLPQAARVAAAMRFAGREPVTRQLPFQHAPHVGGSTAVACAECHVASVTMARERECASCHAQHHRAEANCSGCHGSPARDVHTRDVHLSCGGAGCHAAASVPSPVESRSLCVACHSAQAEHEPTGSCASCHRIPRRGARRTADAGAAP